MQEEPEGVGPEHPRRRLDTRIDLLDGLDLREYRLRSVGAMLVVGFSVLVGLVSAGVWVLTSWLTTPLIGVVMAMKET